MPFTVKREHSDNPLDCVITFASLSIKRPDREYLGRRILNPSLSVRF